MVDSLNKPKRPQNVKITKAPDVERVKISILGEGGTGKTCIAKQYCDGTFESTYSPTIAVDYQTKPVFLNNLQVNINIWDFSGHPEFFEVRNEFYKDTEALILVYDVTSSKSFQNLDMWINEASKYGATNAVVYVCGNKIDEGKKAVNTSDSQKWAKGRGYLFGEVSAKEGTGIDNMFTEIVKAVVSKKRK